MAGVPDPTPYAPTAAQIAEEKRRKLETARTMVPPAEIDERFGGPLGILTYGTSIHGVLEARDRMAKELDLRADVCRLRALPVGEEVRAFVARHERLYVVEQNRDGQLTTILRDEMPEHASRFVRVLQYDGLPLDATTVIDGISNDRGRTR